MSIFLFYIFLFILHIIIDLDSSDPHKEASGEDEGPKHFVEGIPLATSCNDKPCEFEEEFPWNDVRLPSFIQPIRYDIELTPNLTTLGVKGNSMEYITRECFLLNIAYFNV